MAAPEKQVAGQILQLQKALYFCRMWQLRRRAWQVTPKSIQDRYKKLQDAFDRGSAATRRMSGIGGEVGENDELLIEMEQAGKDLDERARGGSEVKRARKEEKERTGRVMSVDSEGREDEVAATAPRKKAKRASASQGDEGSEVAAFGKALRDADTSRVALDCECLDFECERFEREVAEREKDRVQHRKDMA